MSAPAAQVMLEAQAKILEYLTRGAAVWAPRTRTPQNVDSWQHAADLPKEHNGKVALISAESTHSGGRSPSVCSGLNVLYTRHGAWLIELCRECYCDQLQQPLAHRPMQPRLIWVAQRQVKPVLNLGYEYTV